MKNYSYLTLCRFILLFAILISNINLIAQDVRLETQADVDSFDPTITIINGSLRIGVLSGNTDIEDLSNLSGVTDITGSLSIRENDDLTNLEGLNNLSSIGEYFFIHNNLNLVNIDALSNLQTIGGYLWFKTNRNLTNLDGLSNLTAIGEFLYLWGNSELINIDGLHNVKTIGRYLRVKSNSKLENFNGLSSLVSIGEYLSFEFNTKLTNIDFASLESIGGDLLFDNSDDLANFDGFNKLNTVGGNIYLRDFEEISHLDGFSSLTNVGANFHIHDIIKLKHIDGLSNLSHVGGTFYLGNNDSLTNVDGLSGLKTVKEDLVIDRNSLLSNLYGLSSITSIGDDLSISYNENLYDCCSIQYLIENRETIVSGGFSINNNPSACSSIQEIIDNCKLTINYAKTPPCIGIENGAIQVFVDNYAITPLYYLWERPDDGSTGSGISNSNIFLIDSLGAGTYNILVTNAEPDTARLLDITLSSTEGNIFEIIKLTTTNSSNELSNGRIKVATAGGAAPYTYIWEGPTSGIISDVQTDSITIFGLSYGQYIISVKDNTNASKIVEVSLLDEEVQVVPCEKPLDIVILNDASGSVDAIEYNESKQFFVDFLSEVNIGSNPEDSRAAIIEWSSRDEQQLQIPITNDQSILSAYLENSRTFSSSTSPNEALFFGFDYLENSARDTVEKVLILSTDGSFSQISPSLVSLADEFKAQGYHIVTIAFDGAFANNDTRDLLRRVASIDALAPGAPAYSELDIDLARHLVYNYLCTIDPGSSATAYFNRDGAIDIIEVEDFGACPYPRFVQLTFKLSALRDLSLPVGTPVTFYNNDPNLFGATPILTWQIPCAIPIGTSETYTITIPIYGPSNIYAVLNDDGFLGAPISFPITNIDELAYSNNIDSWRICQNGEATLQAIKYSTSPIPACDTLVNYTINVCNISETDSYGVTVSDIAPLGFQLLGSIFNDNGCASEIDGVYDIPADCCLSLTMTYDAALAEHGYYGDQGVDIDGPADQTYIDYEGSSSTNEDITIDGSIDCPSTNITFTKSVNVDKSCDDAFLQFTFTINNEMNIPIQGLLFSDILTSPCTWSYEPYGESGLSISNSTILDNEAVFFIDEVKANTVATFFMDVSLNTWESDGILNNIATLENVPDLTNGGYTTLSSSTTTDITASPKILLPDTIYVHSSMDTVNLEPILSSFTNVKWTTEGDGNFIDDLSENTRYIFGNQDKIDRQVSLFLSASSDCNETGKSVIIKIEGPNSIESITDYSLIKIYPNPFKHTISINSTIDIQSFEILDFNGIIVARMDNLKTIRELKIDMSQHPQGVYLLKTETKNGTQYDKVIKL